MFIINTGSAAASKVVTFSEVGLVVAPFVLVESVDAWFDR